MINLNLSTNPEIEAVLCKFYPESITFADAHLGYAPLNLATESLGNTGFGKLELIDNEILVSVYESEDGSLYIGGVA